MTGLLWLLAWLCSSREQAVFDICVCKIRCPAACVDSLQIEGQIDVTASIKSVLTKNMKIGFAQNGMTTPFNFDLSILKDCRVHLYSLDGRDTEVDFDFRDDMKSITSSVDISFQDITMLLRNADRGATRHDFCFRTLSALSSTLKFEPEGLPVSVQAQFFGGDFDVVAQFETLTIVPGLEEQFSVWFEEDDTQANITLSDGRLDLWSPLDEFTVLFTSHSSMNCVVDSGRCSVRCSDGLSYESMPKVSFVNAVSVEFASDIPSPISWTNLMKLESERPEFRVAVSSSSVPYDIRCAVVDVILVSSDIKIGSISSVGLLSLHSGIEDIRMKFTVDGITADLTYIFAPNIDVYVHTVGSWCDSLSQFPVVLGLSEEGVSSFHVTDNVDFSMSSNPMSDVRLDVLFDQYKVDEALEHLLERNWSMLELPSKYFCVSFGSMEFVDEKPIHGFNSAGCCFTISFVIEGDFMRNVLVPIAKPSELPRYLCYLGQATSETCPTGSYEVTNAQDFTNLANTQFLPGMKKLHIIAFADLAITFNLPKTMTDVEITIEGNEKPRQFSLTKYASARLKSLTLSMITITSSFTFDADQVFIKDVQVINGKGMTFTENTPVSADFVSWSFFGSPKIGNLLLTAELGFSSTITLSDGNVNINSQGLNGAYDVKVDAAHVTNLSIKVVWNSCNIALDSSVTNKVSPVHFIFEMASVVMFEAVLKGSWESVTEPGVVISHGDKNLAVRTATAVLPTCIDFRGSGDIMPTVNSPSTVTLCVCDSSETVSNKCRTGSPSALFGEADDALSSLTQHYVTVQIYGSSSDNKPTFKMGTLGNRKVEFKGKKNDLQHVAIDAVQGLSDMLYAEFIFDFVTLYSAQTVSEMKFNILQLGTVDIDNPTFKDTDILVNDFICDYQDLTNFRSVLVNETVAVSGTMTESPFSLSFSDVAGSFRQDLTLTLDGTVDVFLDKGSLRVGSKTFRSKPSLNITMIETPTSYVTFSCADGLTLDDLGTIDVYLTPPMAGGAYTVHFKGDNWPDNPECRTAITVRSEKMLGNIWICLECQNAPITIYKLNSGTGTRLYVTALQKDVSMCGEIRVDGFAHTPTFIHKVTLSDGERVSMTVNGRIHAYEKSYPPDFAFYIANSTIDVHISTLSSTYSVLKVPVHNCIEENGVSRVFVDHVDRTAPLVNPFSFYGKFDENLPAERLAALFSKNYTILTALNEDLYPLFRSAFTSQGATTANRAYTVGTIRGFQFTAAAGLHVFDLVYDMGPVVVHGTGSIILVPREVPALIPLTICLKSADPKKECSDLDHSAEISIAQTSAFDLSSQVEPYGPITSIQISYQRDLPLSLNFSSLSKLGLSGLCVEIQGNSASSPTIETSKDVVRKLNISGLRVNNSEGNTVNLDLEEVILGLGVRFEHPESLDIPSTVPLTVSSSVIDTLSSMTSHSGMLKIVIDDPSSSTIVFTSDGWEFGHDGHRKHLVASSFVNVVVESVVDVKLQLQVSGSTSDQTKVFGIPITVSKSGLCVSFSGEWSSVSDLGNLEVSHGDKSIVATSDNEYFPDVLKGSGSVERTNTREMSGPFVISSDLSLNNQVLDYDVRTFTNDKSVKIGNVVVEGVSSVNLADGIGQIKPKSLLLKAGSNCRTSTLSTDLLTMEQNAELTVNGTFSGKEINMKVVRGEFPHIDIVWATFTKPDKLSIVIDELLDNSLNEIVSGNFICDMWLDAVDLQVSHGSHLNVLCNGDRLLINGSVSEHGPTEHGPTHHNPSPVEPSGDQTSHYAPTEKGGSDGLSAGAIAGISIACIVVVAALCALMGVMCWRRGRGERKLSPKPLANVDSEFSSGSA